MTKHRTPKVGEYIGNDKAFRQASRRWVLLRRIELLCWEAMRENHSAEYQQITERVEAEAKVLDSAYQPGVSCRR